MSGSHSFDPTVLREYDIRGVVGRTLGRADAEAIGRAFATIAAPDGGSDGTSDGGGKTFCVGYDGRVSSPELEAALVAGLNAGGADVIRVGLGPTPMLYYAVHSLGADGGIMVTGSHNPPDNNGFKLMLGKSSFFGASIQELGAVAGEGAYREGSGARRDDPILLRYVARVAEESAALAPLKVVWDAGNGAAGEAMALLTAELPGEHILLNERIDGTFPAHHPDPTMPENLVELIAEVRAGACDLGIAFDGDGDRIGIVDGGGEILWGDQILALLARPVLANRPGATIIADVKASQVLFDEVARLGGTPLMWKTGHSLIKAKMAETGAPLAGEMSGHIFFADRYHGYDDALYAAVRMLGVISDEGQSLAELRASLPQRVNTPELRFPCGDDVKFDTIEAVRQQLSDDGANVDAMDGVRVNTSDGWWLLRASNTQPVMVARCEAKNEDGLKRLKDDLRVRLKITGIEPPDF
ncbi:MAG: phosphomannomutase/phosphoglucomutase [Alphaproteobacteria bacterium]|jgi:phosphomannomutase|nr:phosphomannomutase/phosphoglucomutase [Alphaproteobacteria bacterium]MDP6589507.1 phosphomannomutase/phosphoglucomutase [Alphaproteobacteria bacterium]MDP6818511.1 phosphomannomutase/phosphoglucomutase [Alphaproteobacteria bacterium]|tara:strand:- start:596 stop:2005 length:1410 start_codon:yes stop_codon:yes gene_type:complete